ncbi:peptidoglycan-binding protein [Streptomyces sp. NBC_01429]|uniref:peptidoglycan-binding protein n=1 Tax=Streptomyces sp. NBC_01429 TaxID=2903862 RepID=UPI002E295884|nr:peptidoglycan-binding protein [Streptomyces sp. NBC_01429]
MTGQLCSACGAPAAAEGGPGCDCAERAARSLRAERSAQAAATEDFDPLRVRPYVQLPVDEGRDSGRPVPKAFRATGPLPLLGPERRGVSAKPPAPDLHTPPPSRAPLRAVAIGAAVVVIAVAAVAVGLFSGDGREEWVAPPEETSTWLPSGDDKEPGGSSPTAVPSPGTAGAPGDGTAPGTSVSAPASGTTADAPDASPAPRPSPSSSVTGKASAAPAAPAATDTGAPQSAPVEETTTLRVGDSGPEVTGLQQRLTRLWLFTGEATGQYDQNLESAVRVYQWSRQLSGDTLGEYGPATRRALEAETEQEQSQGQNQGQSQSQGQDARRGGQQGPGSGRT